MKNIAIVGKMHAGKTTLANELVRSHGYNRVSMAGPLKALAQFAYGEIVEKDKEYETIDRETGDAVFKSGRVIYQQIGQSLKYVDRDIWLKMFINDTKDMFDKGTAYAFVVDDVRFVFEAERLRADGWVIVKVNTPEDVRIDRAIRLMGRAPTLEELNHESEAEVDDIAPDIVMGGTVSLDRIPEQINYLIEEIGLAQEIGY